VDLLVKLFLFRKNFSWTEFVEGFFYIVLCNKDKIALDLANVVSYYYLSTNSEILKSIEINYDLSVSHELFKI